jgi:hypothetical protein
MTNYIASLRTLRKPITSIEVAVLRRLGKVRRTASMVTLRQPAKSPKPPSKPLPTRQPATGPSSTLEK